MHHTDAFDVKYFYDKKKIYIKRDLSLKIFDRKS